MSERTNRVLVMRPSFAGPASPPQIYVCPRLWAELAAEVRPLVGVLPAVNLHSVTCRLVGEHLLKSATSIERRFLGQWLAACERFGGAKYELVPNTIFERTRRIYVRHSMSEPDVEIQQPAAAPAIPARCLNNVVLTRLSQKFLDVTQPRSV